MMMKKGKVVFTLLIGAVVAALAFIPTTKNPTTLFGENKKMEFFSEPWDDVLKEAKRTEKLIFVDLYAKWCGPCKLMKHYTFTNKEVAVFYNAHFINVALDGEKGKGAELMEKYSLRAFPSLLFLNAEGQLVVHRNGFHNPKQFTELGKQVQQLK
ncbi:MAG: thioredoxin family protein [Bacteroidota bacterium]|nr:thioredoxin family protein [Bacteroidota bacterium]